MKTREELIRELVAETSLSEREAAFAVNVYLGGPGDFLDDSDEEPPTRIEAISRLLAQERAEAEPLLDDETPVRVA